MKEELYRNIVKEYIDAYNNFDIGKMLLNMHENVKFSNISNGDVNLTTNGIYELKNQAEQAKQYFKERKQTITDIRIIDDTVEIDIDYAGILAVDLPNGLKAEERIDLKGKSIFRFKDNKIIELQDIS
jgi:hypothetical protein